MDNSQITKKLKINMRKIYSNKTLQNIRTLINL